MVMVFQEYDSTSISTPGASLPPCIVGPCYHIIDTVDDETLAFAGNYTTAGMTDQSFPNNAPGALIEEDSVKFRAKNLVIKYLDDVSADTGGVVGNTIKFPAGAVAVASMEVGDYVTFIDNTLPAAPVENPLVLRITSIDTATETITLNRTCPISDDTILKLRFERKFDEFEFTAAYSSGVTLDCSSEKFTIVGLTYNIGATAYPVTAAEIYVGYKALRQDLSEINTLYSVDEIKGTLGKISPENPLAYGVSIAMANAEIGIECIGVDSNDLAGYTAAKDRLENHDPVYAIVPLTFSKAVLTMFKNHAVEMSKPENGKWRMALGCTEMPYTTELATGTVKISNAGDGDFVVITAQEDDVMFLSNSVDAGDAIYLRDSGGTEHKYVISSVVAEDILTVVQSDPVDSTIFSPSVAYGFRVVHTMTKNDQAEALAAASKAYGDPRFVNWFPDSCLVYNQDLPGYYLACAVAGGIGGLPSHYGFTRLSISGIDAVKNSSDYFNNEQLNIIAGGGTFIFVQASPAAAPYIRHQLTTDTSTIEFQELSFVKNFDYISYICRDTMDKFIGKYNITQDTLNTLRTALAACLETQKLATYPKIGSRIIDYAIRSVAQLENVRDRVEMYADIQMPYPLNVIGLHLKATQLQVISSSN